MAALQCQSDKAKLTVGEHIQLKCSGSISPEFDFSKSNFLFNEADKYVSRIFKIQTEGASTLTIDMTLYRPGEYKLANLILTDGNAQLQLTGDDLKVETVIQPTPDGQPPKPYGELFPLKIQTPFAYYLTILLFVFAVAYYAFYRIKRFRFYRKLKEKIKKEYSSPIAPDTQFYRTIRALEKEDFPIEKLEKSFRLYNLRAYNLPLFDLSDDKVNKYFRRNYPNEKPTRVALFKLLDEFAVMKQQQDQIGFAEKKDFVKKLYRYVDTHQGLQS